MTRIPPRSGTAFELAKGASLTVIDPEGSQVSDLLAYNAQDVREAISNGRTFDYEETLHLSTGNRLPTQVREHTCHVDNDGPSQKARSITLHPLVQLYF